MIASLSGNKWKHGGQRRAFRELAVRAQPPGARGAPAFHGRPVMQIAIETQNTGLSSLMQGFKVPFPG